MESQNAMAHIRVFEKPTGVFKLKFLLSLDVANT